MEIKQQSSKSYFKIFSIIHLSLVFSVVIFGLAVCFFIADFQHPDTQSGLADLLVYLVPGLVMLGIIASNVIFRIKLNAIHENAELKTKMSVYRESSIIRYMFIQGPALFALVAIFVTNNINFLVYAGLMFVLLIVKRPTLRLAISDLNLNQEEKAVLENPDSIVL